jgi:hypothetical protein
VVERGLGTEHDNILRHADTTNGSSRMGIGDEDIAGEQAVLELG